MHSILGSAVALHTIFLEAHDLFTHGKIVSNSVENIK